MRKQKKGENNPLSIWTRTMMMTCQDEEILPVGIRTKKCDAAERAYEAKRDKELAMMQCRELEFLMLDHSTLPPEKRAINEKKQAEIMKKYPSA
nr:hypothetical protein [Tanacetum cinerariifolium]